MTPRFAAAPTISVVVVPLGGSAYLPKCLDALTCQVSVQNVEILVPCDRRVADVPGLQARFPTVRFLTADGYRTYAELRAFGVSKAAGAIVALTEDHCTPHPDWCAQILCAHEGPHAAVGGAVEKEGPDTALNWALYLADYVRYMNPMPESFASELTDCNVSYKRSALEAIRDAWRDEFHEPIVHEKLQHQDESLWFSPRILVQQQRSVRFGDAVRDRYNFGRLFGSGRVTDASTLQRLIYLACVVLIPSLLVGRIAGHIFRRRRHTREFIRSLPMLILLSTAWAWGEFVGYVTGHPDPSLTPQRRPAGGARAKAEGSAVT